MDSTTYAGTLEQMPDQPVGEPVGDWSAPARPPRQTITGRYCSVVPLNPAMHLQDLWTAFAPDVEGRGWTYLGHERPADLNDFAAWADEAASTEDPLFFAIEAPAGRALGVAAYLRITPAAGTVEVGHIHLSPRLQRTPAATEAMYLMMAQAFALGYRRYEWKCDALNAPSRAAAERLGFTFEGIFRQALVYKGRNRDTAWYSVIDREWPMRREAFERWLAPGNFDERGRQRARLSELASSLRMARSRA